MSTIKSGVWGNTDQEITQEFDVNLPNVPDDWYAYAADWGLDYGDHAALDISMERGTPIYAAADGVVTEAGMSPWFRPNPVHIVTPDDPNTPEDDSEEHIYGHMWTNAVSVGQQVRKGDLLGTSGEQTYTGTMDPDGSGPHLHFERRDLSEHVVLDPRPVLDGTFSPSGGGGRTKVRVSPDAINRRIEKSEANNGGFRSRIHGMGDVFVKFGDQYGVNPAVVVAISQRECQLGAAEQIDAIAPYNNFGGNTCGAVGITTSTGCAEGAGRSWCVFPSPEAGIEGMFQTLSDNLYRKTGGRFADVLEVYSPASENDHAQAWAIFAEVGRDLGVDLGPETDVYDTEGTSSGGGSSSSGLIDWMGLVDGLSGATAEGAKRLGLAVAGIAILALGLVVIFPILEDVVPAGRVVKVAGKLAKGKAVARAAS